MKPPPSKTSVARMREGHVAAVHCVLRLGAPASPCAFVDYPPPPPPPRALGARGRGGSKRAKKTCLGCPNGVVSFLETHVSDPFLTPFGSPKWPIFKAIWGFRGGVTPAEHNCLRIPSPVVSFFGRSLFPSSRKMAHFQGFLGLFVRPKSVILGSKRVKSACVGIPSGPGTILGTMWPVLTPLVGPPWPQGV